MSIFIPCLHFKPSSFNNSSRTRRHSVEIIRTRNDLNHSNLSKTSPLISTSEPRNTTLQQDYRKEARWRGSRGLSGVEGAAQFDQDSLFRLHQPHQTFFQLSIQHISPTSHHQSPLESSFQSQKRASFFHQGKPDLLKHFLTSTKR